MLILSCLCTSTELNTHARSWRISPVTEQNGTLFQSTTVLEEYRQFESNFPNAGCDENNDRMDDDAVATTTTAGPGSDPITLRQYAFSLNVWAIRAVERTGLLKSKSELTAHDLRAKVT
eukprot:CAMPEP_0201252046 /NCGR_PEP_ID=MMETSP0852-20130820/66699_1 /ASSEMBLY_ACC=CAM_ASM_000632 /TAXON_ID=183588 /ORGANISM="Pseudo-nitzschia fraudulenta, Strain WWA7" /LENGTH=118 /DNA_ID=CAMNT_0047551719 /DNA_START=498 /DNA_END=850 /DNA_ORIENTATION=+